MCKSKTTTPNPHRKNKHVRQLTKEPDKPPELNSDSESESDDDDEDYETFYVFKIDKQNEGNKHQIQINDNPVNVLIDSGSTINIIDQTTLETLNPKPPLTTSKVKIYPYKASKPLQIIGQFTTKIHSEDKSTMAKFQVVPGSSGSLLGRTTSEELDLLRVGPKPSLHQVTATEQPSAPTPSNVQHIIEKHKEVFKGLGKLKNFELKLHIDSNVTPAQQPIRRLPFHTRQAVSAETKRLLDADIIEPVPGPTTWLNPIVAVSKSNNKMLLCLDMRKANKAIQRERHIIPTLDDILPELHEATVFSKIDL